MTREEYEARAKQLYEELCESVDKYAKFTNGAKDPEASVYVNTWVMVMNLGVLGPVAGASMAVSYEIETFPAASPPHAIKGLLEQGVDEVRMLQYSPVIDLSEGEEDWDM